MQSYGLRSIDLATRTFALEESEEPLYNTSIHTAAENMHRAERDMTGIS
jgi:hypothetical protein